MGGVSYTQKSVWRVGYRSWVTVKVSKKHRLRVIEEAKEKDKVRKRRISGDDGGTRQ